MLLRGLSRLVGFALMLALALLGLAVAVLAITRGSVASDLGLPAVRDAVTGFLDASDEPSGRPVALLAGLGAMAVSVLLALGVLVPRRERLVLGEEDDAGRIAARRRTLAQIVTAIAERTPGISSARARVKPRRRGAGGRITVTAAHPLSTSDGEASSAAREALSSLADDFHLKTRVRAHTGQGEDRVR